MEAVLSGAEHDRAARFGTPALRARYVVGRGTLRSLLAAAVGTLPAEVPLRRGPRGRPELDLPGHSLDFNVSHTLDVALVGILRAGQPSARIGVDIEHLDRELGADRLARRYLTARERAGFEQFDADARRRRFIRLWTCKEAMSKATGDGLLAPMGALDIELADAPRLAHGPAPYSPPDWQLLDVPVTGGYVATVAIWTPPAA
jgi:4'-phosphopantetheinyl transferase